MDLLRQLREIGLDCMAEDETYNHLPEYCQNESRDYWEWETELRSSGPTGERAYALFRRIAKQAWEDRHGDHWTRGDTITRRTDELARLSELRERVRG